MNKQEASLDIGPWMARLFFRGVGGAAAGWWHWTDIPETVKRIPQVCNQAIEMSMQPGFDGGNEFNRLVFECKTNLGAADPWIAGVGGAIAGLVMVAHSVLSRPQDEGYSRWWAAWHAAQGISAVATPAIADILVRRFTVDPLLYTQLQQPDVLAVTALQLVMLAIGSVSLWRWSADLVQIGDEFVQTRYREARARRISDGLIIAALRQDAENRGSDSPVEKRGPGRVFSVGSIRRQTLELSRGPRDGKLITEEEVDRRGEEAKAAVSRHFQVIRNVLNHGLERIKKTAQLQRELPDSIAKRA